MHLHWFSCWLPYCWRTFCVVGNSFVENCSLQLLGLCRVLQVINSPNLSSLYAVILLRGHKMHPYASWTYTPYFGCCYFERRQYYFPNVQFQPMEGHWKTWGIGAQGPNFIQKGMKLNKWLTAKVLLWGEWIFSKTHMYVVVVRSFLSFLYTSVSFNLFYMTLSLSPLFMPFWML